MAVAYESFPNDAHNNRAVTLAEHEQLAVPLGLSGLLGYSGTPPVYADSTGRHIKIRAGVSASIRGTRWNNITETVVSLDANTSGKTRIDLAVLRLRRQESSLGVGDQYTVAPHVIKGVPADSPTAPAPVRDDTPGVGFWDVPLAEVTVPDAAATTTPEQVACRAYYITGSGYTGQDAWGKPPVEPGVIFRANDVGIAYIGTASGTWQRIYYNTGWVAITEGEDKKGWDFRNFVVARSGDVVVMVMYIVRTGSAIGANTHQYFGPVPSQFTPNRTVYGTAYIQSPDHATHIAAIDSGRILLAGNGAQGINTGAQVIANLTWMAN